MVLDTSAVLVILLNEPEIGAISFAIEQDPVRLLSAASFLEAAMVVESRYGDAGGLELDRLIEWVGLDIVPVDAPQARVARQAFRRFGKGRHPAALNFGDCFSYALSQVSGEPLLFKGDDFSKTDLQRVILGQA
ncbi:MAG TPA: type II toxin-antitoxin system VapC family toxin [Thermoanaerobaculia bacterium]|jgi:ribonuclease VapC|nr:type II toxin-antitoxin system VapC family toxin [Thermoanaerobaculia bacterium]